MYSSAFCKVYNEFGWNYFPEAFGEQLLEWMRQKEVSIKTSLDLGCGTGVLCRVLKEHGISAAGMDFSEGMIEIARKENPEISFEVADMITYKPENPVELVTCTGDALNHIMDMENVNRIFQNVYSYLEDGGYFIFDILNEQEVTPGEAIDFDYSDTVKAQFMITRDEKGIFNLRTRVYEYGVLQFEENIREVVHDIDKICEMLRGCGFEIRQCAHHLLDTMTKDVATWFVVARKG